MSTAGPAAPTNALSSERRRVVATASLGTAFEYYDMHIYGLATSLVFGSIYFPTGNASLASIAAFGTFGVAYIARPLGGVVFGHMGDRVGRKNTLQLTFLIMGIATLAIGFLPTYLQIGIAAPVLLVLLRFTQGFAVGGEVGGAIVTLGEYAPPSKRAFFMSYVQAFSAVGSLVGATMFLVLVAVIDDSAFLSWGWRIAFLFAGLLLPLGIYMRSKISESPEFKAIARRKEVVRIPIATVLREQWSTVLAIAGLLAAMLSASYLTSIYSARLLLELGESRLTATATPMLFLAAAIPLSLVGGKLADRYGYLQIFRLGLLTLVVYAYPFFWLLTAPNAWSSAVAVLLMAIPSSLMQGAIGALIAERFRGNVRYTGVSIGYQLGSVIGGGLSPLFAATIYSLFGKHVWALGVYLALFAVIGLLCLIFLGRKTAVGADEIGQVAAPSTAQETAGQQPVG